MPPYAQQLRETVRRAAERLRSVSDKDAARKPAPNKWSAKEIIGHLIDSAANNHIRFINAQLKDDLIFSGYAHEEWVERQGYQEASWIGLVGLWELYNLRLADVMDRVPSEIRLAARARHSLHAISWQRVPEDQEATLDYLMEDYVGHLEHHLGQIP